MYFLVIKPRFQIYYSFKDFLILAQNPKGLVFSFTEECQFVTKTDSNSVFVGRKAHTLDRLHIMPPHISFYGFKKNQVSAQNPKGLAFGLTEKILFAKKTDPNSVFLSCKAHILDQLYILIMYIGFYGF
jgi:hypothetical protein